MKAAIVRGAGRTPAYGDFDEPVASAGENLIDVTAAALSPLVKSRASGAHYSSSGSFPFVAGVDGVGRLRDGRRVYFLLPTFPYGAMAERTVARSAHCLPLPEGIDDVIAAAIANPGMSSWAALTRRAELKPGETVLVNGATGASGRLAVQIAKHLGAAKVIATGREVDALKAVAALGADVTLPLVEDAEALEAQFAASVDVVIDYLWGASARRLLIAAAKAGPEGRRIRFVQIGSASGADIMLPSAVLRSSAIEMMGSGIGSVPLAGLVDSIRGVLEATLPAGLQVAVQPVPLADVETAWTRGKGAGRIVFTMGS